MARCNCSEWGCILCDGTLGPGNYHFDPLPSEKPSEEQPHNEPLDLGNYGW
jgi:hypothetical protein